MEPLDFDYLHRRFEAEHARAKGLSDSLTLPIGVLTAVGGLIGVMGRGFSYRPGVTTVAFVTFLIGDVLTFATCLVFLMHAWNRQDLAYMQRVSDLAEAEKQFQALGIADGESAESIKEGFREFVRASIIEATDVNIEANETRSASLFWARSSLVLVVILTGLVGIPYVIDQASAPKPAVPVMHIDNLDQGREVR